MSIGDDWLFGEWKRRGITLEEFLTYKPRRPMGSAEDDRPRKKATPYRLRAEARSCSFRWLNALTEDEAYAYVKGIRWRRNGGNPYCPTCGSLRHYVLTTRPGWFKCAERRCRKHYSVTSGTIFHSRKLSFLKIVKMMFHFTNAVKGVSALQTSFMVDVNYKSTWVNLQKIRQAMSSERQQFDLVQDIELDGAYFGGTIKQANLKKDRIDRRKRRNGKQRVLMVVRERRGTTVAFAANAEERRVVNAAVRALVPPDVTPTFYVDGERAYDELCAFGHLRVGNHKIGFKVNGASTNLAESAFSRARRAEIGSYHHLGQSWLDFYAGEVCWRENWRKVDSKRQLDGAFELCLDHRISRVLKGYWQRPALPEDQRQVPEVRLGRVFRLRYAQGRRPPHTVILVDAETEGGNRRGGQRLDDAA